MTIDQKIEILGLAIAASCQGSKKAGSWEETFEKMLAMVEAGTVPPVPQISKQPTKTRDN